MFDISFTVTSKVEYYLCLDKFKKTKWLINGSYNSNKNSSNHLEWLNKYSNGEYV